MQILKILNILSSSSKEQTNYLINLGTFPSTDELAIEFEDGYKVLTNIFLDEKYKSSIFYLDFLNKLKEIDIIFDMMSSIEINIFWDVSSLDSQEWCRIRNIAKDALYHGNNIFRY